MIFAPTITLSTPPVMVTSVSNNPFATYNGFLNSLATYVYYQVKSIQKQSNNSEQLTQPIQIVNTDMNGNQTIYTKATPLSDFQHNQNSLHEDYTQDNVWIDNKTVFNFTVLPNTTITFFIDAKTFYTQDLMTPKLVCKCPTI